MEGFLEFLAEARIDNGVDATVEVTQPEGYLKDGLRRLTGWEDGSYRTHTKNENQTMAGNSLLPR